MTHQVYLAGPWFNQDQLDRLNSVREVLTENEISFYDPQKDCLYVPGKISALEVLDMNTGAIDAANFIVCITDGKDTGTMWEAGYSYGTMTPVIYVWLTGTKEQKFNLMLGASGAIVRTLPQLAKALQHYKEVGYVEPINYGDDINYE
jgi:nucleoside 2-deoxyribosyltransferase